MRLKHILEYVQLPAKAKLLWMRITFARVTTIYFVFSVVHCIVQVIIQVQAYSINAQAASFLASLIRQGDAFVPGFAVMGNDLRWCENIPSTLSTDTCQVIWRSAASREEDAESVDSSNDSTTPESALVPPSSAIVFPSSSTSLLSSIVSSTLPPTTSPVTVRPTSTNLQQTTTTPVQISSRPIATTSSSTPLPPSPPPTSTLQATTSAEITNSAPPVQVTNSPVLAIGDDVSDASSDGISGDSGSVDDDEEEDSVAPPSPFSIPLKRRREIQITAVEVDGSREVTIDGFGWNNERRTLNQSCLVSLNWPLEKLEFTKREDIVFIMFQLWVLGMSTVALLNESMPHIIASLLTHILATAWGGFQIQHTATFHRDFTRLTTNGACLVNLLPSYWKERAAAEIPSLVLNVVALLLSAFLSWRLVKLFGWQTFKRVGASRTIDRVYKLVLSLSIAIQLSTFFIVVSIALWIDQLYNGSIGSLARAAKLYKAILITVLLLLLPWLYIGWIGVRRELRVHTSIFLVMAMAYLAGWGAMFASITFRWTFNLWRFFSIITTASVALTILTLLLGIVCRFNFGKGLPHYLKNQEPLPGDDFKSAQPRAEPDLEAEEKIAFPSFEPIPTYSEMFNQGHPAPSASSMMKNPRLGPRFTNTTLEPFETESNMSGHSRTHTRTESSGYTWDVASTVTTTQLSRQVSEHSIVAPEHSRPLESAPPYSGRHTSTVPNPFLDQQKRWVIE